MKATDKATTDRVIRSICGVSENDSRIQAAEKALATMRLAGFSARQIRKIEKMIEDAKARGVK